MIMFSVVYGLYPGNLTVLTSSVYAALGHTAWAVAVAFIVIQCCTGSARMIDSLLSLRLMYPLSRLTYCAYLVHPVIMMVTGGQMDGPLHLHNGTVVRRKVKEEGSIFGLRNCRIESQVIAISFPSLSLSLSLSKFPLARNISQRRVSNLTRVRTEKAVSCGS